MTQGTDMSVFIVPMNTDMSGYIVPMNTDMSGYMGNNALVRNRILVFFRPKPPMYPDMSVTMGHSRMGVIAHIRPNRNISY